jgi:hypothetical protein
VRFIQYLGGEGVYWTYLKVSALVFIRVAILSPYNYLSAEVEDVTAAA